MGDMAVTGDLGLIERYGEMFRRIPAQGQPPLPPLLVRQPLSAGLAGVQNLKAAAAGDFAHAKDAGVVATGDGLVRIAANLAEVDSRGAEAIRQLFGDPARPTGGGVR